MFFQSYTFGILKGIFEKTKSSAIYGWILRLGIFFSSVYKKSIFKKYIDLKPFLNKPWSCSGISWLADKIFAIPSFLIIKGGDLLLRISEGSAVGGAVKKTLGRLGYSNTAAVIFSAIFLCYSTWWNNLYALLVGVILFAVLIYKCRETPLKPSQLDFFVVLFGISVILGVLAAADKADAVRIAIIAVTALIFLLITAISLDSEQKLKSFLKIMAGAIAITAIVAIIQRLMGIEVDAEFVDLSMNEGMPGRVYSTMENPNNYAELLVLFIPFLFALFIDAKGRWKKLFWAAVAVITVVALVMTYSRSCYVAIALAAVIFILVYDYRLIFPLICIAIAAVPFLPETVMNRIFTIGSLQDSSNSYRLYIWDTCVNLIVNYGVSGLGIGPEAFARFYKPIAHTAAVKAPHSHMLYMELVLEYGILGFIGFFGYYIRIIRKGIKCLKYSNKNQRAFVAAGLSALISICFVSAAEYIWFYPRDMFAHFIVMGLLIATVKNIKKGSGVTE